MSRLDLNSQVAHWSPVSESYFVGGEIAYALHPHWQVGLSTSVQSFWGGYIHTDRQAAFHPFFDEVKGKSVQSILSVTYLFRVQKIWQPYLQAGIGGIYLAEYSSRYVPFGYSKQELQVFRGQNALQLLSSMDLGIQIRFLKRTFIQITGRVQGSGRGWNYLPEIQSSLGTETNIKATSIWYGGGLGLGVHL